MKDDKRINDDEKRQLEIGLESRLPRLMSEICEQVVNDFNALFVDMLNEVESSFFTLAEQAESTEDQSIYFYSMAHILNRRSNVEAKFSERLTKALIILLDSGYQLPLERTQLNLEDAEKSRITAIVNKANADNQAELWLITSRFDILLSNVRITLSNNPLSPLSICNIFIETLSLFELQIKAKLSLYDLFERSLMTNIKVVYKKINSILIHNGVLPNLASFVPKGNIVNTDTKSIGSEDNILEALIVLRKENPSFLTKHSNQIRKHLENDKLSLNIDLGQLYDQKTDDIIACIAMLFDFIANDNNLPYEFKVLINKLQIPLLKVALIDYSFLTKGNHPARTLLNELAQAGVGWSRGGGVGLKDKAEEVVNQIINEFGHDITLFTDSLLKFQSFIEQHKKRALLIERRLKEAEIGKAKNEMAKLKANQAIDDIVGGRVLPEPLTQLIHEDWKSVMLLTYLRSGDDSEDWNNHLQTAKDLIAVMSLSEETGLTVCNQLSDIADNIKRGLNVVDYGDYENVKLFQELQLLQERVREDEEALGESSLELINANDLDILPSIESDIISENDKINYSGMPLLIVEEVSTVEANEARQVESKNEVFVTMVESLHPGNWFELQLKEKKVRCKLAAIITSINKYIFVDYTGKKIAEYSKP
ncbi:MAG: hypothetical protein ACI9N9_001905, partial [Enterobacterales bacterium]